ncbi:MAG: hypothetical protein AAFW89_14660 [Bacteroidota bacterium]
MTSSAPQGFFFNLSEGRQHLVALLILILAPFFLYTATTIGGMEFNRYDIRQWRAGAESIIEYREAYNKEPLWASNMFGGMPAYVVSAPTSVPGLDRFLYQIGQSLYPAVQTWILLFGMYVFLICLRFDKLTAVAGSLLYGLTTYFPVLIAAGHTSKYAALAWLPWALVGYWLITRSQKRVFGLFVFSVAMAFEVRAGHPQITYYFLFVLLSLWLYDSWASFKEKKIQDWALYTSFLFIGGIVGVMGNADRLLTLQEYATYSIRGGSAISGTDGLDQNYAFTWSQGIKETLTIWIPDLYGGAVSYWGEKPVTGGPHYFGALSLPFIIIAFIAVRNRVMYAFATAGFITLMFAWGRHFGALNEFAFDVIPYFSKFRAPETWLSVSSLCFSVVSVFGLKWCVDYLKETADGSRKLNELYVPVGGALGIGLLLFVMAGNMDFTTNAERDRIANQIAQQNNVSPQNPQVQQQAVQIISTRLVPERSEKAKGDAMRLVLLLLIFSGLMYGAYRQKVSPGIFLIAIVAIIAFDMISVDRRYLPEEYSESGVDEKQILEDSRRDIDTYIQENITSEDGSYPYRVLPLLDGAFSNAIPSYFYPSLGGYTGAKLSVIQDVIDSEGPLFAGAGGINKSLLNLLNIRYLTFRPGLQLDGFTTAFDGQTGTVYENQDVFPKAFFVDSVYAVPTSGEAYDLLYPGVIDYRTTAVVESSTPIPSSSDSTSRIQINLYNGVDFEAEVERSEPGFLVISEIYYPEGWVARLNGEEVPILKTNYLLRGVEIPAGNHTLSLSFEPQSHATGTMLAWISLGAQLCFGLLAGFIFYRNKNTVTDDQEV